MNLQEILTYSTRENYVYLSAAGLTFCLVYARCGGFTAILNPQAKPKDQKSCETDNRGRKCI